jgi:hypothetical protein
MGWNLQYQTLYTVINGYCTCPKYLSFCRSPLWSSGQSSCLQIRRSGFDFRRYQIFWEVVGLERGPLSLVSTIEELLGRNRSGSGLENRECGRGDSLHWQRDTLYPQKFALSSPTSGGRSMGRVRSPTQATEFLCRSVYFVACYLNVKNTKLFW